MNSVNPALCISRGFSEGGLCNQQRWLFGNGKWLLGSHVPAGSPRADVWVRMVSSLDVFLQHVQGLVNSEITKIISDVERSGSAQFFTGSDWWVH